MRNNNNYEIAAGKIDFLDYATIGEVAHAASGIDFDLFNGI